MKNSVLNEIKLTAETAQETSTWEGDLAIGYHVRQGDVQVERVENDYAKGKEISGSGTQIAPGNSVGSRHVIEGDVKVYAPNDNDPIIGPVMVVGKGGAELVHPEHRNYKLREGTYRTTFQEDFLAKERQRLAD